MQTVADLQERQRQGALGSEPLLDSRPFRPFPQNSPTVLRVGSAFDVLNQQISGSLQQTGFGPSLVVVHGLGPKELPKTLEGMVAGHIRGALLSHFEASSNGIVVGYSCGGFRSNLLFAALQQGSVETLSGALEAYPPPEIATSSKTLASFVGRVENFIGDSAHVLLKNEKTGELLESRCDTEMLRDNGVGVGDEFRLEVVRSKGTTATRLFRIPSTRVSQERVEQIRASFKDRWNF